MSENSLLCLTYALDRRIHQATSVQKHHFTPTTSVSCVFKITKTLDGNF